MKLQRVAVIGFGEVGQIFARDLRASRAGESHPHALPEPYVSLSTHTAPDVQPLDPNGFTSRPGLLPSLVGPSHEAEQCSPFGPAPLQGFPPYYGLLRPCAPLRYSRPCG